MSRPKKSIKPCKTNTICSNKNFSVKVNLTRVANKTACLSRVTSMEHRYKPIRTVRILTTNYINCKVNTTISKWNSLGYAERKESRDKTVQRSSLRLVNVRKSLMNITLVYRRRSTSSWPSRTNAYKRNCANECKPWRRRIISLTSVRNSRNNWKRPKQNE